MLCYERGWCECTIHTIDITLFLSLSTLFSVHYNMSVFWMPSLQICVCPQILILLILVMLKVVDVHSSVGSKKCGIVLSGVILQNTHLVGKHNVTNCTSQISLVVKCFPLLTDTFLQQETKSL